MRECEQQLLHTSSASGGAATAAGPSPASLLPTWPGPPGRDGLPLRCNDHRCAFASTHTPRGNLLPKQADLDKDPKS
eukprot:97622-Chlamydomonas_euryale.AAC.2